MWETFFERTDYSNNAFVHVKFVGHNLAVMLRHHVRNWLITIFHTEFLGKCTIYFHIKFHIPSSNNPFSIKEPKVKYKFHAVAILFRENKSVGSKVKRGNTHSMIS